LNASAHPWEGDAAHEAADPQEEWGREVLARLELGGDETVLDAGCGNGRLTELLAKRLPRGRVIGVDASAEMIDCARERLGGSVELIRADLVELELEAPVDAIFSNAAFHWVPEQERLFDNLAGLLRGGGALEAQCGGIGNLGEFDRVVDAACGAEPFAPYLRGMRRPWTFVRPSDTDARLHRAGFTGRRCWLEPATVQPRDADGFVRARILSAHLAALPAELRDGFVENVLGGMPRPLVLEYVRLNISARRDPA
jgi:trans-aconitate 2-methyltransferase